jgi:hypothetical protein
MDNFVIAHCTDGLCNRLKCLISAMRFAEKSSRTLILCWPKDKTFNCNFSELFQNSFIEMGTEELKSLTEKHDLSEKYKIIHTWRLLPLPEDKLPDNFSRAPFSAPGENIDMEYDRIPLSLRDNYLIYVNRLLPSAYVKSEVDKFTQAFLNGCDTSFNIRTWSELDCGRSRYFNDKAVYNIIDGISDPQFFVSCDSHDLLRILINRYGDRILHYPERTFQGDRTSVEGIQDALIDLLVASKSSVLKLSYISTFSEMIWWFGGCKAKVEMIPLKKHPFLYTSEGYCLMGKWHWRKKL